MKIVAIGDTHGYSTWRKIVETEKDWDRFIFIGDYFDSFDVGGEAQIENFKEIIEFKEQYPEKVILLIGNHDHHYFPEVGDTGTSGYQYGYSITIGHLLSTYRDLLQMAHAEGDFLFVHAGVGETWFGKNVPELKETEVNAEYIASAVNDVWKYKPLQFCFTPSRMSDYYGDSVTQTPIWIRPEALVKDTPNFQKWGIKQVVGHTHVQHINHPGEGSPGYFIDTLPKEFLIINDGKAEIHTV